MSVELVEVIEPADVTVLEVHDGEAIELLEIEQPGFSVLEVIETGPPGPPGTTTWDGLSGKPETFPPSAHTHTFSSLEEIPETFPPSTHTHTWTQIQEKPEEFPPAAHTHPFEDVEAPFGFPPATHTHTWNEIASKPTWTTNIYSLWELALVNPLGVEWSGLLQIDLIPDIREELGAAAINHDHDASAIVSGVLDVARIPVLPSQLQIMSSGAIADLTGPQQAQIGQGTVVTTTDGRRWVYSGTGSKTLEASYVVLADVSPEWDAVANKPSVFATTAALISDATTAGRNLLTAATAAAQKAFLAITMGDVDGLVAALAGKSDTGHGHAIADVSGLSDALDGKADAGHGHNLVDLQDVAITDLADGETLVYDAAEEKWKNATATGGGADIQDLWIYGGI